MVDVDGNAVMRGIELETADRLPRAKISICNSPFSRHQSNKTSNLLFRDIIFLRNYLTLFLAPIVFILEKLFPEHLCLNMPSFLFLMPYFLFNI